MSREIFTRLALGLLLTAPLAAQAETPLERGKYLATILDCAGCHTDGTVGGKPNPKLEMAGSDIGMPVGGLGWFFPPNLTPDKQTGLGDWSIEEIVEALRTGARPDGRELAPVMPWRAYALMPKADAVAIATYLKSLKPIKHQVPMAFGESEKPTAPYLKVIQPEPAKPAAKKP
jgi:hypothetical protein